MAYPQILRVETLGFSQTDSLPILGVKVSDHVSQDEDEPVILFHGSIHAEEVLGTEIILAMLHQLTAGYGTDSTLTRYVRELEIWTVPIVNPDGHNLVSTGVDTSWRKNTRDNNENGQLDLDYDGVDLNRNWDFNWQYGDSTPPSSYYRGPAPFSESETRALRDLYLRVRPVVSVAYHSPALSRGEIIYYPWRWRDAFTPDHPHIRAVAESTATRIVNDAGTGTYLAVYERATTPKDINWLYWNLGTFGLIIEVCSWRVQPPDSEVADIVARNLVGAYYLMERVLGPGITGRVRDARTGAPIPAEVRVLEAYADTFPPRRADALYGRFYRLLLPGTYTLQVVAEGYEPLTLPGVTVGPDGPTEVEVYLEPVAVGEEENAPPLSFWVVRAPGGVRFHLELDQGGFYTLRLYRADGRRVATLFRGYLEPGGHRFYYALPRSGVYFYHLIGPNQRWRGKLLEVQP